MVTHACLVGQPETVQSDLVRAWQVHRHGSPLEALQLVELDEPTPGPGEVRLKVRAAA